MINLYDNEKSIKEEFLSEPVIAMAYVPMQQFNSTFSPMQALISGTLFPELRKPFEGKTVTGGGRRES